jgi:hypothetical protein
VLPHHQFCELHFLGKTMRSTLFKLSAGALLMATSALAFAASDCCGDLAECCLQMLACCL